MLEVNAPVAARGDVTVKIGASRGSYAGKPSTRPYELTVHTGTAPRDVTMGNVALTKLVSKNAYDAASTGWYYENGVVLVKTAPISTSQDATVRMSGTTSVGGGKTVLETFGTPELTSPSLWNAPGQATEVTATFTNAGTTTMRDVRLALNLPAGWTATGTSTFAKVEPGQDRHHEARGDPSCRSETGQLHSATRRVVQGARRHL